MGIHTRHKMKTFTALTFSLALLGTAAANGADDAVTDALTAVVSGIDANAMPAATEATDKASASCFSWTSATGGGTTAGTTFANKASTTCASPDNGCVAFGYNSVGGGITIASSAGSCAEGFATCADWE